VGRIKNKPKTYLTLGGELLLVTPRWFQRMEGGGRNNKIESRRMMKNLTHCNRARKVSPRNLGGGKQWVHQIQPRGWWCPKKSRDVRNGRKALRSKKKRKKSLVKRVESRKGRKMDQESGPGGVPGRRTWTVAEPRGGKKKN